MQWKALSQEVIDMVAGLECFDLTLMPHIGIILLGILIMTPLGENIARGFSSKWPSLESAQGRALAGLILVSFGGFTVSAHTLWMHNKAAEMGGGSFCSSGNVCDCASVIGNPEWNTVPFIGLAWGLLGMLAFALFMWLAITIAKEPGANWVIQNIKVGVNFGIFGLFIVLYLMYAEYDIGKICQFCTTAHVAHVVTTVGFIRVARMVESGNWNGSEKTVEEVTAKARRKRGGYVAPKQSNEEE